MQAAQLPHQAWLTSTPAPHGLQLPCRHASQRASSRTRRWELVAPAQYVEGAVAASIAAAVTYTAGTSFRLLKLVQPRIARGHRCTTAAAGLDTLAETAAQLGSATAGAAAPATLADAAAADSLPGDPLAHLQPLWDLADAATAASDATAAAATTAVQQDWLTPVADGLQVVPPGVLRYSSSVSVLLSSPYHSLERLALLSRIESCMCTLRRRCCERWRVGSIDAHTVSNMLCQCPGVPPTSQTLLFCRWY